MEWGLPSPRCVKSFTSIHLSSLWLPHAATICTTACSSNCQVRQCYSAFWNHEAYKRANFFLPSVRIFARCLCLFERYTGKQDLGYVRWGGEKSSCGSKDRPKCRINDNSKKRVIDRTRLPRDRSSPLNESWIILIQEAITAMQVKKPLFRGFGLISMCVWILAVSS